jgi:hypothetical protein
MIPFLRGLPTLTGVGRKERGGCTYSGMKFDLEDEPIYKWYNLGHEFCSSGCWDVGSKICVRGLQPKLRARAIARSSP